MYGMFNKLIVFIAIYLARRANSVALAFKKLIFSNPGIDFWIFGWTFGNFVGKHDIFSHIIQ